MSRELGRSDFWKARYDEAQEEIAKVVRERDAFREGLTHAGLRISELNTHVSLLQGDLDEAATRLVANTKDLEHKALMLRLAQGANVSLARALDVARARTRVVEGEGRALVRLGLELCNWIEADLGSPCFFSRADLAKSGEVLGL